MRIVIVNLCCVFVYILEVTYSLSRAKDHNRKLMKWKIVMTINNFSKNEFGTFITIERELNSFCVVKVILFGRKL